MKPLYRKLPAELESSFSAALISCRTSETYGIIMQNWELHYTIRGEGIRFIGDNISQFGPDEIILVGEKLSHAWRCREEYFLNNPDYNIEAIVLQFLPDCMGKQLLQLPEAYLLPKLFEKAKSGLIVKGDTRTGGRRLDDRMCTCLWSWENNCLNANFKTLAESDECETIVKTQTTFHRSNEADNIRLNNIFNYTHSHYKNDITLDEVSNIANLSVTSFCRYFKTMTRKTYYDFLVEIRISHACRLLVENKLPTEVICFECGFNNVSNFYRHFKKIMGMTPLEYKKRYLNRG